MPKPEDNQQTMQQMTQGHTDQRPMQANETRSREADLPGRYRKIGIAAVRAAVGFRERKTQQS
jgi:hypothetical protein